MATVEKLLPPKYSIEDRTHKYALDIPIVLDQMRYVEKISPLFEPLNYRAVPVRLVDEDYIDTLCPPKKEQTNEFVKRIAEEIGESVKKKYEELYGKAIEKGLKVEKIPFESSNWIEWREAILDFCLKPDELFTEEARRLRNKVEKGCEYLKTFEGNVRILVAMGCFVRDPSTLTYKPTVLLCPRRIRRCADALRQVQDFQDWVRSLENPLHKPPQRTYVNDIEYVYRMVIIHEHAHAATVPKDKAHLSKSVIDTMDEGIAQWITFETLKEANEHKTLSLFESHAEAISEEYKFYKLLCQIENKYGLPAVISVILSWSHSHTSYNWDEFIKNANKGIFCLRTK